jgi:acyl-CoA thioesterase-2
LVRARRHLHVATPAELVRHVDVQPRGDPGTFVGRSVDLGWGRVYGGQSMAQCVAACQYAAGPSRTLHRFDCTFLKGGDVNLDMEIETEEITSGRSFSAVHARMAQAGKPVLAMTASLQTPEEGFVHQCGELLPEWRTPHELPSLAEHMQPLLEKMRVPAKLRAIYTEAAPIEMRPVEFVSPWDRTVRPPHRAIWMRAKGPLPDDPAVHQRLIAYMSDWSLLETALFPHPSALWGTDVRAASLTHTMTFHAPVRADEWHCHAMRSPAASGARGFALGEFWSEGGTLVASSAQEGLIRPTGGRAKK